MSEAASRGPAWLVLPTYDEAPNIEAIVEAIETGRFDVWVPKSTVAIATFMNVLPRRGREAIARLLKADDILATADKGARASYEERAAQSQSEEAAAAAEAANKS